MINEEQMNRLTTKEKDIDTLTKYLQEHHLTKQDKDLFKKYNLEIPKENITYYQLLKRPEIKISFLKDIKSI